MPRADKYIAGLFPSGIGRPAIRARRLTYSEAANLSTALRADAVDLYYSGWISFLDSLNGIKKDFYTWATVKLYYSVFYCFRASLALGDVCVFHIGRLPFTIDAQPGAMPVSCDQPGTHKVVLTSFQRRYPGHPLVSQQIDLEKAVDWFMGKRESANYGDQRFTEPNPTREFHFIAANGIRKTLNAYLNEESSLYVFDPDHAMVAFPLHTLQLIGHQLKAAIPDLGTTAAEQEFLKTCAKDNSGNLAPLIAEMKRLTLVRK